MNELDLLADIIEDQVTQPLKLTIEVIKDQSGDVIGIHALWDAPTDELEPKEGVTVTTTDIYEPEVF